MLKEVMPESVQQMIIGLWYDGLDSDKEIAQMIPPPRIREALLIERGLIKGTYDTDDVRDWLAAQQDAQTRAMRAMATLREVEPLNREEARLGRLPSWAVQKWADGLCFDWGAELMDSVIKAEDYLNSKKIAYS